MVTHSLSLSSSPSLLPSAFHSIKLMSCFTAFTIRGRLFVRHLLRTSKKLNVSSSFSSSSILLSLLFILNTLSHRQGFSPFFFQIPPRLTLFQSSFSSSLFILVLNLLHVIVANNPPPFVYSLCLAISSSFCRTPNSSLSLVISIFVSSSLSPPAKLCHL